MTLTSRQARRAAKKTARQARKQAQQAATSPEALAAGERAVAAFNAARAAAVPADHYQTIIDGLVERGAPADVLDEARWLVDMARRWHVHYEPAVAMTEQMAPVLDLDVEGMVDEAAGIRRLIARGLLLAASWKP